MEQAATQPQERKKKLILFDGMAMVYRAYFALGRTPRMTASGMNTSAILGFTTSLYDLLRQQRPTHAAVAFDLPHPTFRHEMYTDYKANREATPEVITESMPYIRRLIEAFDLPVVTLPGYEADDIIGTLAHRATADWGFDDVLMVTPDKDFAQLVNAAVRLFRFGRMGKPDMIMGVMEVQEKFGVERCEQVADILGLWGDSIDNIPGIPGVGEKKARQLVNEFGSVEALVERADEVKNDRLREQVKTYAAQALLSKKLATISVDAPVECEESQLRLGLPHYDELRDLFEQLEFRNFAKKFFTDLSVSDPETAVRYLSPRPATPVAVPTQSETPQLSLFDNVEREVPKELIVHDLAVELPVMDEAPLSVYIEGAEVAVAVDADHAFKARVGDIDLSALKRLLECDTTTKVCYDLKNLRYMTAELGITLAGNLFDVQLAHYLINAEARHTFDFICRDLLGTEPAHPAACAAALWQLYPLLSSKLCEAGQEKLYNEVELPLVDVLIDMEREGVRIDVDALRRYSSELSQQRDALAHAIYEQAGGEFNIGSTRQLGEVLYEQLCITDKPPRTSTKQYSTAEEVLQRLQDRHPIVGMILEYRSLSKLLSTYLDSFPKLINPETGRLHTVYNQAVTATGRLSSSNPNLQNIPIRTDRGREIRRAFVARDEGHVLLAADYSQIELRIIAAMSGDEHMTEAFANHYDIHAATAAKIYGVPLEAVTKEQRRNAKSVNFGIIYGISAFGLSEQLHIPRKESAALIEEYFAQYPAIKAYTEGNVRFAREHGYAQTMLGRRRYLPDINSRNATARAFAERNAVNMPIQGTSADMIKIAMNRIHSRLTTQGLQSKMILQVHDELVFDVPRGEVDIVRSLVREEMLAAMPLAIPIEVGIEVGDNWLEAH